MARLVTCGFELNSTGSGVEYTTNSSATIQTSIVRSGKYALRNNTSSGTTQVRINLTTSDQGRSGFARLYLYIASLPSVNTDIIRWINQSGTTVARMRLNTDGTLNLINTTGSTVSTASSALSTATWYRVEMQNNASAATGVLTGLLDGVQFGSGNNSIQGQWARVDVGVRTTCTADLYMDDIAVNDSTGGSQNTWPGAGSIVHCHPNAAGDSTQWTIGGSSAAGTNFGSVSEETPDDGVTLVKDGTLNHADMYGIDATAIPPRSTVNVVAVGVRYNNDTADATAAFKAQIEKAPSGTKSQSAAIVPNSTTWVTNGAQAAVHPLITYTDPDGSAWTRGTLDTAQIGVITSTAGTNKCQVSDLWAAVEYVAPTSSPNSTMALLGV
ncbi:MAG: hypothetical protein EPO06_12090 [Burkholderiaceae bacterium]|nr:MAG: hypothetical protein EPO06_12090 [Burkholderiaceae bacterium]